MTEEVWLKQVNILDLRVHIKLLEEVKLRICHLGGTIKRIPLMDNKVFDCYVAVLMCNTKIGVKLLEYHQEDGNNPYTDPFVMATWLAAMGYFGEGLEIRNEEAHQLAVHHVLPIIGFGLVLGTQHKHFCGQGVPCRWLHTRAESRRSPHAGAQIYLLPDLHRTVFEHDPRKENL